jgi:hypothetical protein
VGEVREKRRPDAGATEAVSLQLRGAGVLFRVEAAVIPKMELFVEI